MQSLCAVSAIAKRPRQRIRAGCQVAPGQDACDRCYATARRLFARRARTLTRRRPRNCCVSLVRVTMMGLVAIPASAAFLAGCGEPAAALTKKITIQSSGGVSRRSSVHRVVAIAQPQTKQAVSQAVSQPQTKQASRRSAAAGGAALVFSAIAGPGPAARGRADKPIF